MGLTPAEKLVGSLDHLVASGNNDTLEGGGTSDKESSPRPEESVGTKEKLPGKPYDSTVSEVVNSGRIEVKGGTMTKVLSRTATMFSFKLLGSD